VTADPTESPATLSRRYKILVHRYLAAYEQSLYLDANIQLLQDPAPLFEKYRECPLYAPIHKERGCVYSEADFLKRSGKLNSESLGELCRQLNRYGAAGFPRDLGLTENNVLLRRFGSDLEALMERWWEEFTQGCRRDQVSLPYVLWKAGQTAGELVESPRGRQVFFQIHLHEAQKDAGVLLRCSRLARLRRWQGIHYASIACVSDLFGRYRSLLACKFRSQRDIDDELSGN
jgi:hypothetical protein